VAYPHWKYFPRNVQPPTWVDEVVNVVASAEKTISTEKKKTGLNSDAVLLELRAGLGSMGFEVESGKKPQSKISRPVLFGENGTWEVHYEIDAFHAGLGIALEVEAGRAAANNADYRDIVRTSLILDADYLVLLVPITYRSTKSYQVYNRCRGQLDAVYASSRLRLPLQGVLLVGY
jgi:hypothetical protein